MSACTMYSPLGTGEPVSKELAEQGFVGNRIKGGFLGMFFLAFKADPVAMTKAFIVPTDPVGITLKIGDLMKMANEVDKVSQ